MTDEADKSRRKVPAPVLKVLERMGHDKGVLDVRPLPGTGNRSHLVSFADDRIVVRFDGRETGGLVNRELEHRHGRLAAQRRLGPEILFADIPEGILVTRFVEGIGFENLPRPYADDSLGRLAVLIASLQTTEGFAGLMDPWQKIALYLHDAEIVRPDHVDCFGSIWPSLEALRETTAIDHEDLVPCHVDPVPENILDREQGAMLLDWEYAARSHRLWDLAYFASEASLTICECVRLLEAFGKGQTIKELRRWIVVAKAVSFAWCLARRARATLDRQVWDQTLVERRMDLRRCLDMN